jgi:predicted DCC family thiol-disulfide oxidoreductase YuxK
MKKFNPQIIFFHFFFIFALFSVQSCLRPASYELLSGQKTQLTNELQLFVFLNTQCPICQAYQGELKNLNQNSPQTPVYYVFCGQQPKQAIIEFCNYDHIAASQVILDTDFRLAKKTGATVTPQVIISQEEKILYSGKIDDRYENIGSRHSEVSINYINNALFSLTRNEDISIKHTEPVGCFIEPR